MIEHLPVLTPDAWRSARTLERCHRRASRKRQQPVLAQVAFAGLCVLYLATVAIDVARVLIR